MRATYFPPRGLASSGFFVRKSSWHQSKGTWLKMSLGHAESDKEAAGSAHASSRLSSSSSSWRAQRQCSIWGERSQAPKFFCINFLIYKVTDPCGSPAEPPRSSAKGRQTLKVLHCHYSTPVETLNLKADYRGKMFLALCISPGLPDKQLRHGNSWLCCRLSLNQNWEDSPYWH